MRASLRSDVVNLFGELKDVYNELYGNEKDWKKVSGSGGFMQRLINEYGLVSLAEMEVFFKGMTNGEYISPYGENATGVKIGSLYGYRTNTDTGKSEFHEGWDLGGYNGVSTDGADLVSIADGKVLVSEWVGGYGNTVVVQYYDPMLGPVQVLYGHMQNKSLSVSKGDLIEKGQVVGK